MSRHQSTILVIDDEQEILEAVKRTLFSAGMTSVELCANSRQAEAILTYRKIDLVLLDLNMPFLSGYELLGLIKKQHPEIPVIIFTVEEDIEKAVECMRAGAEDYLLKRSTREKFRQTILRVLDRKELVRENRRLQKKILTDTLEHPAVFAEIITNNRDMLNLFKVMEAVAPSLHPVFISGESGTGKELIAGVIHELSGLEGKFVTVNASQYETDNNLIDELFGHARGAYTGAAETRKGLVDSAKGGTLFLDEIGDLNLNLQSDLLRFLETGEYRPLGTDRMHYADIRIITATNHDLKSRISQGKFRSDLFNRLYTHMLHIPPLRTRLDDLPLLIDFFINQEKKRVPTLLKKTMTPDDLEKIPGCIIECLEGYPFPGNIRELKSLVIDCLWKAASPDEIGDVLRRRMAAGKDFMATAWPENDSSCQVHFPGKLPTLKQMDEILIREAMKRSGQNQSQAGRILDISQQALSHRWRKMQGE